MLKALVVEDEKLEMCIRDRDSWYQKQLTSIADKNYDYRKLAQIFMDTKDKLLRSVNIQLLADQMLYKMKEVMK